MMLNEIIFFLFISKTNYENLFFFTKMKALQNMHYFLIELFASMFVLVLFACSKDTFPILLYFSLITRNFFFQWNNVQILRCFCYYLSNDWTFPVTHTTKKEGWTLIYCVKNSQHSRHFIKENFLFFASEVEHKYLI